MQNYFYTLADAVFSMRSADEIFTCYYSGESSDFVRFNHGKYRQQGHVEQHYLQIELIANRRSASYSLTLKGNQTEDIDTLQHIVTQLRSCIAVLPEDPYLLYATDVQSTTSCQDNQLPPIDTISEAVIESAQGLDLVGILAAGGIFRGFANSLGQRNYFSSYCFHIDCSLYHHQDKAIKLSFGGLKFDKAAWQREVELAKARLPILGHTPKSLTPGRYRVYLTPEALGELIGMLSWGGLSEKALRTKQSPLLHMRESGKELHPSVSLSENIQNGVGPSFTSDGFIKPAHLQLIEGGKLINCLISPRTAQEYSLKTNGSSDGEMPVSLEMAAGNLPQSEILARLGTGIYIGNLWYLNFSDKIAGKITGMTRFGTFWVENGQIVAPLNVMRFDDTIFHILGTGLEAITQERSFMIDNGTYEERSTHSTHLPGILVKDLQLTL